MKVYIAASLKDVFRIKEIGVLLKSFGHKITCDWTILDENKIQNDKDYRAWAIEDELRGVKECDAILAVLPGGRGTHIELGIAIALDKKIILYGDAKGVMMYDRKGIVKCQDLGEVLKELN